MVVKRRAGLLAGTVDGASFLIAAPAFAQDAQTQKLQNQINALQQQLQSLQGQVTQTKQRRRPLSMRCRICRPASTMRRLELPLW